MTAPAFAPPTFADVEAAATLLAGIAHPTPVMTSRTADAARGASVFFKMENFQRGGAFKFRGAYNAIARLDPAERARGVVAFSSGNHAQAVAIAAGMLGVAATIVMPSDAPAAKVAATRDYGATIITYDRAREDREAVARQVIGDSGAALIPPFDHPHVIAGQGTAACELFAAVGPLDRLYVPVGGGGLLAGSALAAATLSPGCRVIGVEPAAGDDVRQSLAEGRRVAIPVPKTIADGAQTTQVGALTFPIIQTHVAEIMVAEDAALRHQMRFFLERMKVVAEPTGCLAAAAALATAPEGARVGVIVSGGNVDIGIRPDAELGPATSHLAIG